MKDKKIIKYFLVAVLILGIFGFIVMFLIFNNPKNDNEIEKNDAIRFKEEYESLNNTIRESDGAQYNNVSIDEDNPMIYIDVTKALEILESKKAIIYIGANWCPWCRNAVPVMIDAAKDLDIDVIYYLNLDDEKSNFKVEDGELVEINHGSDSYYKLLDILSDYLTDYVLTDEDGNKYETGEKRIYMPYVITIKNGKVASEHLSTVTLDENQTKYDSLTDNQYNELYNIYYKMFDELYNGGTICAVEENCS